MKAPLNRHALGRVRKDLLHEECLSTQLSEMLARLAPEDEPADCAILRAAAAEARHLAALIEQNADRPPLKIAIVGDYSAGKSSFINHLLGDDTLCPIRDDPTTSHVTVFRYAADERIIRTSAGGRTTKLTRAQYTQQVQSSDAQRTRGERCRFTVSAPIDVLLGIELLDTPGFNNLQSAVDTEATESVLGEADAVLFLVDANIGTIPDSGTERLRNIRAMLPEAPIRVVFSKADTKAPSRMRVLMNDCQQRHGALFTGQVLAYSSRDIGPRPDIATRAEMGQLFQAMCLDKQAAQEEDIADRIHLHIHARAQLLQRLGPLASKMMEWQAARAAATATAKVRLRQRFDQLQAHMERDYQSEVRDALRASLRVEEIAGTGWVFKDARIVRNAPTLPAALTTFKSVGKMRERLCADVGSLVRESAERAVACADLTCRRATADTARNAEKRMEQDFGHLFGRRYDYDTTAREKMWAALADYSPAIAEALWSDWVRWIDGLYELLDQQHLTPAIQDAESHIEALRALLDAYQLLPADAVSVMMELA